MRFTFDLFWQQETWRLPHCKKSASQRSGGASPDFHILDLLSWEWRIMYILLLWPRNHIAKMRMEKNLHIKWSLISAEVCLCNTRLSFGFSLIVFCWLAECETASPPCLMIAWGVTVAPNPPPPSDWRGCFRICLPVLKTGAKPREENCGKYYFLSSTHTFELNHLNNINLYSVSN